MTDERDAEDEQHEQDANEGTDAREQDASGSNARGSNEPGEVQEMRQRLEDLDEEVDAAKRAADDLARTSGRMADDEDGQPYVESGTIGADQDDQQIAPPG